MEQLKTVKMFTFLLLFVPSLVLSQTNPAPTQTYPNTQILATPDLVYLYWDYTNLDITFELHFKTSEWILFGVQSPSYSDVIVGAMFDDGTGHYSQRTLYPNSTLNTNTILEWFLLDAFETSNYTVLKFQRNLRLQCGQTPATTGLDIQTGSTNIVFATGSSFDQSTEAISITNLKTVQINLLPTIANGTQLSCVTPSLKPTFSSTPTGTYSNWVDLVPEDYRLYWNTSDTNLTAEIHVRTRGWVAFGFSPNGGMINSNVVVGFITSGGQVSFSDRFIKSISPAGITRTSNQSVQLLAFGRIGEFVFFKFTRPIKVCDSEHISINKGAPSVIYAFGTTEMTSVDQDLYYHGSVNRGSQKLNILNKATTKNPIPSDSTYIDFTIKHAILPRVETYYYIQIFKVPDYVVAQKQHVHMIETILPEYNKMYIHHTLMLECARSYVGVPAQQSHNSWVDPAKNQYCGTPSIGWAVGGDLKSSFPDFTGYPVGGDGVIYFAQEIHYNNPDKNIGYIHSLTLRLYMTKQLRQHEVGILTLGTESSGYGIAIPPRLDRFDLKVYCHNKMIKNAFQSNPNLTNITILMANPHTHLAGVSMETRIIRNGRDIGFVFANHEYDFNYQQAYLLDPYVNITENDELITTCSYQTKDRDMFTLGGHSTHDEMCFHFLVYYPRGALESCASVPYIVDYVDLLNNLKSTGDVNLNRTLAYTYDDLTYGLVQTFTQFATKPVPASVSNRFVTFFNTTRLSEIAQNFDIGPFSRINPPNVYVEPSVCVTPPTQTTIMSVIMSIIDTIRNFFNSLFSRFF